uniref:Uncharacterized protein n=1 Tax=Phasianus colchicus TaxID=9054 RepID=A0A669QRP5_PHACC
MLKTYWALIKFATLLYGAIGIYNRLKALMEICTCYLRGLLTVNKQVQANSKMLFQARLALDFLLGKEKGLCGYLKLYKEHYCVYIPNVTEELDK